MHRHPLRRFRRRCHERVRTAANTLARRARDPEGPFSVRVKPSGNIYRRHPRHRLRALAEFLT